MNENTCTDALCLLAQRQPEACTADDGDNEAPFNEDCGDDEQSCSTLANNADGSPVRFSSGRVETNPITLISAPTPDGMFFGYRLQWSSHREFVRANQSSPETQPTIHDHNETTYYIGKGWMDDFSDRLYIKTKSKQDDKIVWQRRDAIITFTQVSGAWRSWGGKYELIDRGTNTWCDGAGYCDSYGRWVIRTVDTNAARKIWAFEEYPYTGYAGSTTYWLGRLRRHALLGTNVTKLTDVYSTYGYSIVWDANGYITDATDSLGRKFTFSYVTDPVSGSPIKKRALSGISYTPASGATPTDISIVRTGDWKIDRINVSAGSIVAPWYVRFLYNRNIKAPQCTYCPIVVTDVIVPGNAASSTAIGAPPQPSEIVIEHNDYSAPDPMAGIGTPGLRAVYSKYPGREYGYAYAESAGQYITTQFDLHQYVADCVSGACASGGTCWNATDKGDNKCYVARTYTSQGSRLPTQVAGQATGFSRTYRTPTAGIPGGTPQWSTDAAGITTSFGFDTTGRLRCRVVNDDAQAGIYEAFADPANPNTSACSGPTNSQVLRIDYDGPCSDGYSTCVLKTTTGLLGGSVVEETDLDTTTLLAVRTKVTGQSHDINGTTVSETHVSTTAYDANGRVVEVNGPLSDTVALDKKTTGYWGADSGDNTGHVRYETLFVGTSASNTSVVTEYTNYDPLGVPHKVIGPNGDFVTYDTTDRLTWTIKQWAPGGVLLATSTVVLNPDGTIRSITDADGVCLTYEYSDVSGYVGAPTRIKRTMTGAECGSVPINTASGEVELRTYIAGEPDRLESIERRTNGVVEYVYSGFAYDTDRRLTAMSTVHSTSPFTFTFTDVLQTGVTAPEGPGPGTWRTEQTVDQFARPSGLLRFIDGTNKLTHNFSYSSTFSPRPTQITRGYNGAATSVSSFEYDDFGRLLSATVPEAGAPGSPAATRYEYDVGGRLIKKRSGIGTALVRTDVITYDSLGRVLSVDNDIEHPVSCASAPSGTPIQDAEYKYDTCEATDRPAGFSCSNALGRMTIARSILQCGTGGVTVKRGRWYDYTAGGNVARVAYATVTGGTIGAPAIMEYTYTASGRLSQYSSPINSIYGTKYTYSLGRVSQLDTTQSTPVLLANGISWYSFGPLATLTSNAVQTSGSSTRKLKYESSYYNEGQLNQFKWRLVHSGGPVVAPISLVYQNLSYTPAGLIKDRYDFGNYEQSRYYGYDSLLRLTCEARGQTSTSTTPTAAHCTQASALAVGLFTYGNGENATSPPDVRLTSFQRGEGTASATYISPSTETSTYSSGSSQLLGVSRSTSSLVLGHDPVGRRSYDYDNFDSTRSRRDYTYLPNGQLGSISGRSSSSVTYSTTVRYDEDGRPLTINETRGGAADDAYELFWDDADRLIAVNISFASGRACGYDHIANATNYCSGARWHYHYLDKRLIAATRELIPSGVGQPSSPVKRYFVVTDERGLVHRYVNGNGGTESQWRWSASGSRYTVGEFEGETWVPFGLPGQVILGKVKQYSSVDPNWGIIYTTTRWGSEAYASGTGGTWTRPPIALNRYRAYDALSGAFLQPDPADTIARDRPEGYMIARNTPVNVADATGAESSPLDRIAGVGFHASCDLANRFAISAAITTAILDIETCALGECGLPGGATVRRVWIAMLSRFSVSCPKLGWPGVDKNGYFEDSEGASGGNTDSFAARPNAKLPPAAFSRVAGYDPTRGLGWGCLAQVVAHEALHDVNRSLLAISILGVGPAWYQSGASYFDELYRDGYEEYDPLEKGEDVAIQGTVLECVKCRTKPYPIKAGR